MPHILAMPAVPFQSPLLFTLPPHNSLSLNLNFIFFLIYSFPLKKKNTIYPHCSASTSNMFIILKFIFLEQTIPLKFRSIQSTNTIQTSSLCLLRQHSQMFKSKCLVYMHRKKVSEWGESQSPSNAWVFLNNIPLCTHNTSPLVFVHSIPIHLVPGTGNLTIIKVWSNLRECLCFI